MIPAYANNSVESQTDNGVVFTIDEEDMAFIFGILRNNIYSNSIKIVVQEYLCNGRDAHREAKKASKPMDVIIPSCNNPVFVVRDYGNSLTYEQMVSVFCKYGKSTKRGTNQTGGFGLGAKSAWAYGSEFFVETFIDGTQTKYRFFIDSDTQRGKMEVTSNDLTDEENGLKVIVPVKENDISSFSNWYSIITHYWGVKPNTNTKVLYYVLDDKVIFEDDWILYSDHFNKTATIMVDDIPYPIDYNSLKEINVLNEKYLNILKVPLVLFSGPDDVHVAATREQLNYTKKTVNFLVAEISRAYNQIESMITEEMNQCKTYIEALQKWTKEYDNRMEFYRNHFPNINWQEHSLNIKEHVRNIPYISPGSSRKYFSDHVAIWEILYNSYSKNVEFSHRTFLHDFSSMDHIIIIEDQKGIPRQKIRNAIHKISSDEGIDPSKFKGLVFMMPSDANNATAIMKFLNEKLNLHKMNTIYLKDFIEKENKKTKVERGKKTKKDSKVFFKVYNFSRELSTTLFDSISAAEGVYCFSKYNSLYAQGRYFDRDNFYDYFKTLEKIIGIERIIMIPEKYKSEVIKNKKLVNLDKVIEDNKYLYDEEKCKDIEYRRDIVNSLTYKIGSYRNLIPKLIQKINEVKSNDTKDIILSLNPNGNKSPTQDETWYLMAMISLYGFESKNRASHIDKVISSFKEKYPLLNEISLYHISDEIASHIIVYINAIDKGQ